MDTEPQNSKKEEKKDLTEEPLVEKDSLFQREDGYWISNKDNVLMAEVSAGEFFMGTDIDTCYQDECPPHQVRLERYLIDREKVTKEIYQKFLQAQEEHGGHNPAWCHPDEPEGKSHIPDYWHQQKSGYAVTWVDWYDAWAFAAWAQKSLPTEAQWEKACKTTVEMLPYEDNQVNKNNNKLIKIIGNGWEWCLDSYQADFYRESPVENPYCRKESADKVVRGGIYKAPLPWIRSTFRNHFPLLHRNESLSIRCVKTFT